MQNQPPFTPTNPRMPFYQTPQGMNPYAQPAMNPYSYFQKPPIPVQNTPFPSPSATKKTKQQNPLIGYFQTDKGEMDMDKVFHTVNQLASTFQQVSPLVKNVGSFIKSIQK